MDILRAGTTSAAMIDAGKNKDLAETWSKPEQDDPDAEAKERLRLQRLVDALRAKRRREQGEDLEIDLASEATGSAAGTSEPTSPTAAALKENDWQKMVEQLLRSYEFFKPLEVIYQEVPAEEMIFRQTDPPDGCWVILSAVALGCISSNIAS